RNAVCPESPSAIVTSSIEIRRRLLLDRAEHLAAVDVLRVVAVVGVQVRGDGVEGDEAPVGRDRGILGKAVPGGAGSTGGAADELGRGRLQVAHVDVVGGVAVDGVEVGGAGGERDEAPVGRDRGVERLAVRLGAVDAGGAADERGRVRLRVAYEHIADPV